MITYEFCIVCHLTLYNFNLCTILSENFLESPYRLCVVCNIINIHLFLKNILKPGFLSDGVNLEVLRDLSILQIHTRDLEGFRDTRFAILHLKSVYFHRLCLHNRLL